MKSLWVFASMLTAITAAAIGNPSLSAPPSTKPTPTVTLTPAATATATPTASASGGAYLTAFFALPATVPIGEPTGLAIAVINPSPRSVSFAFTATLPPHLAVAPVGAPPQNTCGGTVTASPDGTTVTSEGRAAPAAGCGGCGVVLPVIADRAGTYTATDIVAGPVTGVPARIAGITGITTCGPRCAALSPTLIVTADHAASPAPNYRHYDYR
ncbi:hypothetical protein ACPPVO_28180 [Dactylosporangium sp. McL0621]|uniref:DUF7933 domain-containing protein n=1 Tax=Dactylosporangium sp. McL0621 TaxID=3415678 RepID=UPI003CEE6989